MGCIPDHQSKWFDRLSHNVVHFILTLFIYLFMQAATSDDYSDGESAFKQFFPLFFFL